MSDDFRRELEREEAERPIPPQALVRVRARLDESIERPPHRLALVVVALTVLVLSVGAGMWALRGPATLGGFEVVQREGASTVVHGEEVSVSEGSVTMRAGDTTLTTQGTVIVAREAGGVRVKRGTVHVSVLHQSRGAVRLFVSHGTIEVVGTRFTIEQRADSGTVTLEEGSIRFRSHEGVERTLSPGQSLSWPEPPKVPEAEPPPEPPAPPEPGLPRPPSPRAQAPELSVVLEEVEVLRSRGEFEAAARLLSSAMPTQPKASRERLSFELGSLLTHQLRQTPRACAHWATHVRQFPRGRYADEVARAREALGCSSP